MFNSQRPATKKSPPKTFGLLAGSALLASLLGGIGLSVFLLKIGHINNRVGVGAPDAWTQSADAVVALKAPSTKWVVYKTTAGYPVAVPSNFAPRSGQSVGDMRLTAEMPDDAAVSITVKALGSKVGAQPFQTWQVGLTPDHLRKIYEDSMGNIAGFHPDNTLPDQVQYTRPGAEDEKLNCSAGLLLVGNVPVIAEVCATYNALYTEALLEGVMRMTPRQQASSPFLDMTTEKAVADAAAQDAQDSDKPDFVKAAYTNWSEGRQAHCYGKLTYDETEACFTAEAKDRLNGKAAATAPTADDVEDSSDDDTPDTMTQSAAQADNSAAPSDAVKADNSYDDAVVEDTDH